MVSSRAVRVHPFAEVGQGLLAGFGAAQGFELLPFIWLGLADEIEDGLREDGAFAVKGIGGDAVESMLEQVLSKAHSEWRGSAGIG